MEHSDHWIATGRHEEQWNFQNHERQWNILITGWHEEQWNFQNNEMTMKHFDH